jgi:hypothetical protein
MFENKRKRHLLAALVTLFLLAFGVGCRGFFVNPTVTGIAVGPTGSIQQTKTLQEVATATYDDGTTKTLGNTSGVVWSIADASGTDVATISSSGLVSGVNVGTATVTGAVASEQGTATVTVTLKGITSIQITPKTSTINAGDSQQYVALANGGSTDISTSVQWKVVAASGPGVSIDSTGLVTTSSTDTGTVNVTATDQSTGIVSNTAVLTLTAP